MGNELWPDLQIVFPYKMEGMRETITPQLKQLIFGPGFVLKTLCVCRSDKHYTMTFSIYWEELS